MMLIDNKHEIGDIVYCRIDPDRTAYMVFAFKVYKTELYYICTRPDGGTREFADFEITERKEECITT
jgi:hypothetical protein